jgi:DNA-binding HxlR family transcriptional regulator
MVTMAEATLKMVEKAGEKDLRLPLELLEDPLDVAFEIVGKKWTVHVLREAMRAGGVVRFNELGRKIKGINAKSLSARLKELEGAGILERRVVPGTPVHTEYHLTSKGWALRPILIAMAWFSLRWSSDKTLDKDRPPSDSKIWKTLQMYCGDGNEKCGWPWDESEGAKARA